MQSIERQQSFEEGFLRNIDALFEYLKSLGQLSNEQLEAIYNRISREAITPQELAVLQRDLASWQACWNTLIANGSELGSDDTKKLWRESQFYAVLETLIGKQEAKRINQFVDEANQYIDLKRISVGGEAVGVRVATTVQEVLSILTFKNNT